jgi:hypothetical protein
MERLLTLALALEIPLALDILGIDEGGKRNQSPLLSCCSTAEYILIMQKLIAQADKKIETALT